MNTSYKKSISTIVAAAALCAMSITIPIASHAGIPLTKNGMVEMYGDFRFRLESDWDSRRSNGTNRDDRNRARIRARLGFKVTPEDDMEFGVRFRTGSDDSNQSPHITIIDFDDNDTGDADVNLDKWYLKLKGTALSGWVGRNSSPFWKQNELFWDDDVTPAGIALNHKTGSFGITAGYFSLPVGMQAFSGNLGAVQGLYHGGVGDDIKIKGAIGYYKFDSNSTDPDAATLRNENGSRDYAIWVASLQVGGMSVSGIPLTLGVDIMRNEEDYSATDPGNATTAANYDQTDGYVVSVHLGKVKNVGDWQFGYYYADIEKFAVNSSYAQDDWVRWGSAVETDSSDFKGHELRFKYGLKKNMNLVIRFYSTEALTSVQDGKRLRFDLNYKF